MGRDTETINEVVLFPMELIDRFVWNAKLGAELKKLRENFPDGHISRAKMVKAIAEKGVTYSEVSLRTLERGDMASIQKTLLVALLEVLEVSPAQFFGAKKQIVIQ